jgi:lipopolysaccharide transport system ATP-binding protein
VTRFIDQGKTIMFVSHTPGAIRALCKRVCVLDRGELVFDGPVDAGLAFYEALLQGGSASMTPVTVQPAEGT